MVDCFVGINVTSDNVLLNNKNVPIIFYWDGESDIIEDMKANDAFMKLIYNNCINTQKYSTSKISLVYINNENAFEKLFDEKEILIEDLLPINECEELTYNYVIDIFLDLYKKVTKNQYEYYQVEKDNKEICVDIIKQIKENVKKEISTETILNYIFSKIDERWKISKHSKELLIEKITNDMKES